MVSSYTGSELRNARSVACQVAPVRVAWLTFAGREIVKSIVGDGASDEELQLIYL